MARNFPQWGGASANGDDSKWCTYLTWLTAVAGGCSAAELWQLLGWQWRHSRRLHVDYRGERSGGVGGSSRTWGCSAAELWQLLGWQRRYSRRL
jgi:hypothetical protein